MFNKNFRVWIVFLSLFSAFAAIAFLNKDKLVFRKVSFSELKGWENQDFKKLAGIFKNNCTQMKRYYKARPADFNDQFGSLDQWGNFCSGLESLKEEKKIKNYFEKLDLLAIKHIFEDSSLFTGYYSPVLNGSLKKEGRYQYPVYKKPKDLVSGNLEDFYPWHKNLKFKKIYARLDSEAGVLYPYYTRKQIEEDNVLSKDDILVWVDSKIDLFFLQIQGSGKVKLKDGSIMYVGYSSQNGHKYQSVGSYLIKNNIMRKEDVSMQAIKSYLETNPHLTDSVLQKNPSYIFFSKNNKGPYGAFGNVLTPNYSVAVDREYIPLGVPLYIKTKQTADNRDFQRMVFAQDIGGAIKGEVRADIYFGDDEHAEIYAGKQNSSGKMYVFSAKNF